jgi:hypothetical protein
VFYVGKGTHTRKHRYDRANYIKKRNKLWVNVANKTSYTVELFATFFDELDCFQMEIDLIAFYGKKSDGGTLCNLTNGGEGHNGYSPTSQTREKLRQLVSDGKHPNFGKKLSEETCRKKSESMRNSNKSLKGKTLPDWWKQKIADTKCGKDNPMFGKTGIKHPNSKPVIHLQTGVFFENVTEAALWCEMSVGSLYNRLKGYAGYKNNTGLEFA